MREESQKAHHDLHKKEIKTEPIKTEPIKEVVVEDGNDESISKITCPDLENKFLLVRVGTNDRPSTDADIKEVEEKLEKMLRDNNVNCLTFVTHHAIDIAILI